MTTHEGWQIGSGTARWMTWWRALTKLFHSRDPSGWMTENKSDDSWISCCENLQSLQVNSDSVTLPSLPALCAVVALHKTCSHSVFKQSRAFWQQDELFSSVGLRLAVCAECVSRSVNTSWGSLYNLQRSNMPGSKLNQTLRTAEGGTGWLTRGCHLFKSTDICLVGQGDNARSDFSLRRVGKQ